MSARFCLRSRRATSFRIAAAALLLSALAGHVQADDLAGTASVIDGDTIEIHGQRIRLFGIDAPESRQLCQVNGKDYRCGQQAALALSDFIGRGTVACKAKDKDRYGRVVAVCHARGEDLNAWMVHQGWALAYRQYSRDYVAHEEEAQRNRAGIWAGAFTPPWDWRRGQRATRTAKPASQDCRIKGNISRNGRIYHMPGDRFYGRTRISESKGERWFCSEAEATAAGWRRAHQ